MFPFANYKKLHFFFEVLSVSLAVSIHSESENSQSITLGCQFSVFKNAEMTSRHSKTPNAATFSTPLLIISAPAVRSTICRMRPVTFSPPLFICAAGGLAAGAAAGGGAAAESGTGAAAEATSGRRIGTEDEAGTTRETRVKRGRTRRGEPAVDTRSHVHK